MVRKDKGWFWCAGKYKGWYDGKESRKDGSDGQESTKDGSAGQESTKDGSDGQECTKDGSDGEESTKDGSDGQESTNTPAKLFQTKTWNLTNILPESDYECIVQVETECSNIFLSHFITQAENKYGWRLPSKMFTYGDNTNGI